MYDQVLFKKACVCGLVLLIAGGLAAQPNWTVNPAEYQFSMIITAQLRISGVPDPAPGNIIVAYAAGQVRGVATPVMVSGQAYYFLTVYAHTFKSDTLTFKAYIAAEDAIFASTDTVLFKHNTHLGTIGTPFPLDFGPIQEPQIYSSGQVNFQENTCFELYDVEALDNEDTEGNGLVFSITGGADAARFSVDSMNGKISWFNFNPDFEAPADADADNIYQVKIRVSDLDGYFTEQLLSVKVSDNVYEVFDPQLTGNLILCPGQTATLQINGGGTYLWSNGATTDVLSNLPAGTYTVTVTNAFECTAIRSDTVSNNNVGAGAIGTDQTLCPGFNDPAAFTEISPASGTGALSYRWESGSNGCNGSFSVIANATSTTYDVPSGLTQTTSYRRVAVSTVPGSVCEASTNCVLVTVLQTDNQPPSALCQNISVQLNQAGTANITAAQVNNGSTDNCGLGTLSVAPSTFTTANLGPNTVTLSVPDLAGNFSTCTAIVTVSPFDIIISGKMIWEVDDVTGVKDVSVQLNGPVSATFVTDVTGSYSFTVTQPGNYTLSGSKQINRLNGVTSADVTRIQQHVVGNFPLTDPYKIIAADINHNNGVSAQDVSILQQAILNNPAALAIFSVFWRFPNAAITLNNPPWPQLIAGAEQISLTGVNGNQPNQHFAGIKVGDVIVSNANPANKPATSSPLIWRVQDEALISDEEITVTFRAMHFEGLSSYQFGLGFDPALLQFKSVQTAPALGLQAGNFGLTDAGSGEIRTLWAQPEAFSLVSGDSVFSLTFKVMQGGGKLSDALWLDAGILAAEAYSDGFQQQELMLEFETVATSTGQPSDVNSLQLLQNRPNPFSGETSIGFILPAAAETRLRIFETNGRLLRESVCDCAAGYHEAQFRFEDLPRGILYYELTTPFGVLVKKMMGE